VSYARDCFMIAGMSVTIALLLCAAALATGTNVFYRSVLLEKEIATRRVLGARRSHIVAMFLLESMTGVSIGVLFGAVVVALTCLFVPASLPLTTMLISTVLLACAGAIGGWVTARHAANTPFGKSGLFRAGSDKRGE
jgi:ABC-type antimicrobial peptide transport system permease subunit